MKEKFEFTLGKITIIHMVETSDIVFNIAVSFFVAANVFQVLVQKHFRFICIQNVGKINLLDE